MGDLILQRNRPIEPITFTYPYDPTGNPKQIRFHSVKAKEKLLGGAAGGGKTDALLAEVLSVVLRFGVPGLILRKTTTAMGEITQRLLVRLPPEIGKWNEQKKTWTFRNGGRLMLGYLERDSDVLRYAGNEYGIIAWDELTQFTEWQYLRMFHPLRVATSHPGYNTMRAAGIEPYYIAATNPGGIGHCVPYGEVLTPRGWIDIKEMVVGDSVFSLDPEGEMVLDTVNQVHSYLSPEIIQVDVNGFHMSCTPEHRVAKTTGQRGPSRGALFSLVPFNKLPGQATILRSISRWNGTAIGDTIVSRSQSIRKTSVIQPTVLNGVQYSRLLGWFLTEGYLIDRDRAVCISQSKPETREKLRKFLEEDCGFKVSWSKDTGVIYAPAWYEHLRLFDFGKCRDKYVPRNIKNATTEELAAFFEAAMDGDGCTLQRKTGGYFYTTSKHLADDLAEIGIRLGYLVRVTSRTRPNRVGLSYAVGFKKTKSGGTELMTGQHQYQVVTNTKRRSNIQTTVNSNGIPTWCIGVAKNHNFIIRQKGSVWISGNSWCKSRFIDPAPEGVVWRPKPTLEEPNPGTRVFVPARVWDNPHMPQEYINQLKSLPPDERRMLLDGDWDVYSGQYFGEFRRDIHVIEPEELPVPLGGVQKAMGIDFGVSNPFVALWGAIMADDTLVIYRELGKKDVIATDQPKMILASELPGERSSSRPITPFLDPSAWQREATSPAPTSPNAAPQFSVAWHYARGGLPVRQAYNQRIPGWQEVKRRLQVRESTGKPGILIYSTCRDLIRTLPIMTRSKINPEDLDTTQDDHWVDSLRYLCTGIRRVPPHPSHDREALRKINQASALTAGMLEHMRT